MLSMCCHEITKQNARYLQGRAKDSFIGPQEFVVGHSKPPAQPQSSARPICHSHTMTSTWREPVTIRIAAYRSSPLRHCATGDDDLYKLHANSTVIVWHYLQISFVRSSPHSSDRINWSYLYCEMWRLHDVQIETLLRKSTSVVFSVIIL